MKTGDIVNQNPLWIFLFCALILGGCSTEAKALLADPLEYPEFIGSVQPEPGSTFSLSDPTDRNIVYHRDRIVCVHIYEQPLLHPYDHFNEFTNIELTFDGDVVSEKPSHEPTALEAEGLDDGNGNIIATGVESDLICWNIKVLPGVHVAEIRVWTSTNEEFTYNWAFDAAD